MTKNLIDPYNKLNILIKYGKGSYVYDQNDKKCRISRDISILNFQTLKKSFSKI